LRAVAYTVFAIVLGLALTVGPVYVLTVTEGQDITPAPQWFSKSFRENLKEVEGTYANKPTVSQIDVEFFAITFVVALSVYLIIRAKMPDRKHKVSRLPF